MKATKLIALFILGASLTSFSNAEPRQQGDRYQVKTAHPRVIKWKSESVDLGEIPANKPVTIEFEFTNESDAPVIVTNAQASCGCTVAAYPKEPILAEKKAIITATYNAAAKGAFTKTITVYIQNEEPKVLNFHGTVL
jgi:Protein of unknown function (DUF1573)